MRCSGLRSRSHPSGREGVGASGRRGRPLFDDLPRVDLELVRRLTTGDEVEPAQRVLHLRYRVRR